MTILTSAIARSSLVATLAAPLLTGGAGVSAAQAADLPAPAPAAAGTGPADGVYRLSVGIPDTDLVWGKSSSCAEGEGRFLHLSLDPGKFSQQWRLIKQPSGAYILASMCQPTTLVTNTFAEGGDFVSARFGSGGPTSALGSWNPSYDYNVAHTAEQEWKVVPNGDGTSYTFVSDTPRGSLSFGATLIPAN